MEIPGNYKVILAEDLDGYYGIESGIECPFCKEQIKVSTEKILNGCPHFLTAFVPDLENVFFLFRAEGNNLIK